MTLRMVQARVMAVASGGTITVRLSEKTTNDVIPVARAVGTSAVVGDNVMVQTDGRGGMLAYALLGVSTAPDVPAPAVPVDTGSESQTVIRGTEPCFPDWAGSWQLGRWRTDTTDVIQGAYGSNPANKGAAFFGGKPSSLGTLTGGRLWYTRLAGAGNNAAEAPTLTLLAGTTRPASTYPTVTGTATGTAAAWSQRVMYTLTAGMLAALQAGTSGGFGTADTAPYMRLDGETFALYLDWERTI